MGGGGRVLHHLISATLTANSCPVALFRQVLTEEWAPFPSCSPVRVYTSVCVCVCVCVCVSERERGGEREREREREEKRERDTNLRATQISTPWREYLELETL